MINRKDKYKIDTTKLKKRRYNNYKDLCNELEIKEGKGSTKKSQLEIMKSYFKFERQGNAYLIKKIYNKQKYIESPLKENKKHIDSIERLIVDMLIKENLKNDSFSMRIGRYQLLKEISVINENYSKCKYRKDKLSKYLNININTICDWYNSTDYILLNDTIHALDRLQDKSIIMWENDILVYNIRYYDKTKLRNVEIINGEREESHSLESNKPSYILSNATELQKKTILNAEKFALDNLGYETKSKIIVNGLWDKFQDIVKDILVDYDIASYYNCFHIIYSIDNLENVSKKYSKTLSQKNQDKHIAKATNSIKKNINSNIDNKINNTNIKSKENKELSYNEKNRLNKNYKKDTNNLTNKLIDTKIKSFWRNVKEVDMSNTDNN